MAEKETLMSALRRAEAENQKLNARVEELAGARASVVLEQALRDADTHNAKLAKENTKLRAENTQLKDFLRDYGMQWVGSTANTADDGDSDVKDARPAQQHDEPRHAAWIDDAPPPSPPTPSQLPDLEHVRRVVDELNIIADDEPRVGRRADGTASFVRHSPALVLTFWLDGLQVDGGELRLYASAEARAFLKDLLDGYFPYELKHAYPGGVRFVVDDRTRRRHDEPAHDWGAGRVLASGASLGAAIDEWGVGRVLASGASPDAAGACGSQVDAARKCDDRADASSGRLLGGSRLWKPAQSIAPTAKATCGDASTANHR